MSIRFSYFNKIYFKDGQIPIVLILSKRNLKLISTKPIQYNPSIFEFITFHLSQNRWCIAIDIFAVKRLDFKANVPRYLSQPLKAILTPVSEVSCLGICEPNISGFYLGTLRGISPLAKLPTPRALQWNIYTSGKIIRHFRICFANIWWACLKSGQFSRRGKI